MPKPAILILAAGASSRMGALDKLTMEAQGTPLLQRVITRACATTAPVFAVLPSLEHPRAALIPTNVTALIAPDWADGMACSIAQGVAGLPDQNNGVMILPGDMPNLTSDDLNRLIKEFENTPNNIIRATSSLGQHGHPVIFPPDIIKDLHQIKGDQGARAVIKTHATRLKLVELPGDHAICDLDTPEDWQAWRKT